MDMSIVEYTKKVAELAGGVYHETTKNNNIVYHGVVFKMPKSPDPIFYVDGFYESGLSPEESAVKVEQMFEELGMLNPIFDFPKNLGEAAPKLTCKLVSIFLNDLKDDCMVLASEFYEELSDLTLIPRVEVKNDPTGIATAPVDQHMLDMWNTDLDTVVNIAMMNLKESMVITSIESILGKQGIEIDTDFVQPTDTTTVVTNKTNTLGASCIIPAIPKLYDKFPNGFIVLPSSVHETIIMPKKVAVAESALVEMVREINKTVVRPEDRLSDKIYIFD